MTDRKTYRGWEITRPYGHWHGSLNDGDNDITMSSYEELCAEIDEHIRERPWLASDGEVSA